MRTLSIKNWPANPIVSFEYMSKRAAQSKVVRMMVSDLGEEKGIAHPQNGR